MQLGTRVGRAGGARARCSYRLLALLPWAAARMLLGVGSVRRARGGWECRGWRFVLICMSPVLAMLELDGPTDALLAAAEQLDGLLETPEGLLARIVAPTETGVVLWQLWQTPEARARNADDPAHGAALRASGLLDLVTGTRARAFEGAALQVFSPRTGVDRSPRERGC